MAFTAPGANKNTSGLVKTSSTEAASHSEDLGSFKVERPASLTSTIASSEEELTSEQIRIRCENEYSAPVNPDPVDTIAKIWDRIAQAKQKRGES